jgi:hypothetical protein
MADKHDNLDGYFLNAQSASTLWAYEQRCMSGRRGKTKQLFEKNFT